MPTLQLTRMSRLLTVPYAGRARPPGGCRWAKASWSGSSGPGVGWRGQRPWSDTASPPQQEGSVGQPVGFRRHFDVLCQGGPETRPTAVLSSSSSQEHSDSPGAGTVGAGCSLHASLSLPGQGSALIKMPGLQPWPRIGHLPGIRSPSPHPQPQKRFLSPYICTAAQRQMHQSFQGLQT